MQFIGVHDGSSRGANLLNHATLDASQTSPPGSDPFNLGGAITGVGHNLTLTGTSAVGGELGGAINLGGGTLTKDGAGFWALDVANTLGAVTIKSGTLARALARLQPGHAPATSL